MKHFKILCVVHFCGLFCFAPNAWGQAIEADWVLKGGTVYDGSDAEGKLADVAIKGGKIVAVGKLEVKPGAQTVDCQGLVVCPGFIDLHNHSDRPILDVETRANVNFLTQGCTTVVTGNCGFGPVDVGEYFKKLDQQGCGTNVIHLLPQGSLRQQVVGSADEPATEVHLQKMKQLAEQAMQDGAYGMSTGLIYVPGTYSTTEEIAEIAKVVAQYGGIYASHIRNENTKLLEAINEALEIGKLSGAAVHVSHFKASGVEAWGSLKAAVSLIEKARSSGQRVTADQYPYVASSTSLEAMLIPTWARSGGQKALLARMADEKDGPKIRTYIERALAVRGEKAPIRIAKYNPRPDWVGKSISEIATAEKREPVEIVWEIQQQGGASGVSFGMQEEEVRYAMQLPWVATASDGSAKLPGADRPHPRNYGTFPRKIGLYSIEEKVLPLAAAIRSASGLPADILHLSDRGYLRPQQAADVVVFSPEELRDEATFDDPHRYSSGVRHVFVNGRPAIMSGTPTGALAGKALRKPATKKAESGD